MLVGISTYFWFNALADCETKCCRAERKREKGRVRRTNKAIWNSEQTNRLCSEKQQRRQRQRRQRICWQGHQSTPKMPIHLCHKAQSQQQCCTYVCMFVCMCVCPTIDLSVCGNIVICSNFHLFIACVKFSISFLRHPKQRALFEGTSRVANSQ